MREVKIRLYERRGKGKKKTMSANGLEPAQRTEEKKEKETTLEGFEPAAGIAKSL